MAERNPILITGATGRVGGQVLSRLRDARVAVRALVRDPEAANLPGDVEMVAGDLSDASSSRPPSTECAPCSSSLRGDSLRRRRRELFPGMPGALVYSILSGHAEMVTNPEPMTSTVEDLNGTRGRAFQQWAVDHAQDFR